MFYSTVLLAAAAFSGAVTAQSMNETGTGPKIDAGSVSYAIRQQWCRIQTQNCPRICGGATMAGGNICDPNTLSYSCVCNDGMSPNISSYEQTLPAYECREYIDQCVTNHPNDLEGITACRATECGTKLVDDPSESSSSSSASSSATASSTRSGSSSDASETPSSTSGSESASETSGGAEASASGDSSAASALTLAGNYGTGLLAVGILAAFGFAL